MSTAASNPTLTLTLETLTISTALITAGGIATLSAFDVPLLRSQPASRSLPLLRWLFSRGSHVFPTGIIASSAGFASLAWTHLAPSTHRESTKAIFIALTSGKPALFLTASLLSLSTALYTSLLMLPTNFELIRTNESLGGAHSANSAAYRAGIHAPPRSAEDSVDGKDDLSQWTDGSGPQEKTEREAGSKEEEERVSGLLGRFGRLNWGRAAVMGAGGVVGLVAALV